jgi:hypothetical protein
MPMLVTVRNNVLGASALGETRRHPLSRGQLHMGSPVELTTLNMGNGRYLLSTNEEVLGYKRKRQITHNHRQSAHPELNTVKTELKATRLERTDLGVISIRYKLRAPGPCYAAGVPQKARILNDLT